MAIKVLDLIKRVQNEITMDTDTENPRWPVDTMIEFVKQTAQELTHVRKHLLLDSDGLPRSSEVILAEVKNSDASTLSFPERYTEAMMHGVAMRCFLMDAADQNNATRATYERTRFYELAGVTVTA